MNVQKVFTACLSTLLSISLVLSAHAAPTDAEANEQIDNAINRHYAAADIGTAEQKLLDLIKSCTGQCSQGVLGRAWMYVGIVRGSGRDDVAGAQEAFRAAKAADPAVKLDAMLATDLVKRLFAQTTASPGDAMPLMDDIRERAAQPEVTSNIRCSLDAVEVETQRPIPISCEAGPGVENAVLSYSHEASARWHQVTLKEQGTAWVGEIPCSDTKQIGVLSYRVQGFDAQGNPVDTLGTEEEPLELSLVETTDIPPPSLPNQPPPASCRPKKATAPAGPKLGSYGDACSDAAQCQGGLTCMNGTCAADVSCDTDEECASGSCIDNICVLPDCEGDECESLSRVPGNWVGLQGGLDFAMMSGEQVCGRNADLSFSCFEGGAPYRGVPNDNFSGSIDGGFRTATARVMLSYERVLSSIFSVEGRFGFAFNGGPESATGEGGDGSKFLPFHAEARVKTYFSKVYREDGSGLKGPSGFVMLGGGLAQVDPHVSVPVGECRFGDIDDPGGATRPISGREDSCRTSTNQVFDVKDVEVYQRLGTAFVTAGVGLRYGIGRNMAAVATLNAQVLLPSTGFTLSPSLGVAAGF